MNVSDTFHCFSLCGLFLPAHNNYALCALLGWAGRMGEQAKAAESFTGNGGLIESNYLY